MKWFLASLPFIGGLVLWNIGLLTNETATMHTRFIQVGILDSVVGFGLLFSYGLSKVQ